MIPSILRRRRSLLAGQAAAPPRPSAAAWARPPGTFERVLEDLVAALEAEGVGYAFLRGQREFPRVRPGSDVDLLVEPGGAAALERALVHAVARRGAVIWDRFRAGSMRQYYLYAYEGPGRHAFLELDVHTAEACYGVPFLDARRLLAARSADWPRSLPKDLSALVDFLGPYLSSGVVERRSLVRLCNACEPGSARLRRVLADLFGERRGAALLRAVLAEDETELGTSARIWRRALLRRAFLRSPLESTFGFLRFALAAHLRPLVRPRGRFVALLGTDGAGKSTLLAELQTRLAPVFRSGTVRAFHLRPRLLPQLEVPRSLGRSRARPEDFARPHHARPSGAWISGLRSSYSALDYLLGHALCVLPLQRRTSLVLFERYFDDQLVDPHRYRLAPAGRWRRFLARRVPRPDVVLVCNAEPATIQARTRELEPEETARRVAAYARLALERAGEGFHLVRTEGDRGTTLDQAIRAIFAGKAG